MSDSVRRLGPRSRAVAAAAVGAAGAWLVSVFLRTPQYSRIPDPRVVPINGLHWLVLGLGALAVSGYAIRTLERSTASDADATDPERPDDAPRLDALRHRYATGEITEAEFERRLDAVLDPDATRPDRSGPTTGDDRVPGEDPDRTVSPEPTDR
jgi:hypothetical protein